ncbi:MAG TPA: outer membrane beta-barrel protein, partial [Flavobacterium sp.]|nr:outer membrane beta-barrel protein [Flavobacterium sp.]
TYIEKVMVGGDDLFNRGYSILTKNMPNKPLDKVEILRNYSNNKLLKGVEESNKVALNLTIDEEYQNIWFGDISLNYGLVSENRYDVTGNLMNFSNKYKNFLNIGLNNVGIDRVGSLEGMFYNNYEIETVGQGNRLFSLMHLSEGRAYQLKDHRTRINNAENVSLSSIVPLSEKFKVKLTGFLGFDENYAYNNQFSTTDIGNTYFENTESKDFKNHLKTGYINLLANYDLSKTQMLQASSMYNYGNSNSSNNLTFNGISTLERLQTRNTFTDHKLTYTHKWNDRNVVLLKMRYFSNDIPQNYHINDYLMGDLFDFDAQSMRNDIQNSKTFLGVESDFKLRQKNGDLIEFQVGHSYEKQKVKTRFQLFDDTTTFLPDDFQSNSDFGLHDIYAKSGYTWDFGKAKLGANAEAHQLFNRFNSEISEKKQNYFYLNPSVNFNWDVKPTHVFSAFYNLRFQNTDFLQVNDSYLLSSSRSFRKGLGEFKLTDNQMANINYSIRHYLNRYSFSLGLDYSTQSKVLSSRSTIEQNSSLSESIFIKGGETYGANFRANFYWREIKSNFKFESRYSVSTSYNEINQSGLRKNQYATQFYNVEWKTRFKFPVNFHIGTEWSVSEVKSPDFSNSYTNGFTFLDVFFTLGEKLDMKAVTEHYYFGSLEENQRNHFFLDLEATYRFKDDKYAITIRGNNLFNKQDFTTYSVSDIGYSQTFYRLMPRYVLIGFKTRFNL